ncbi:hypothetical protein [Bradyrhizobium lablabi]|uniref:hypothetical protein n=1 Tax=Bradyrhizobium lablabi TaxID=722472 RepID=UPI000A9EB12B|nr:hypothetical protein [Bradyrhizobium lablabi]
MDEFLELLGGESLVRHIAKSTISEALLSYQPACNSSTTSRKFDLAVKMLGAAAQTAGNRGISALASSKPLPNGKQCRANPQR